MTEPVHAAAVIANAAGFVILRVDGREGSDVVDCTDAEAAACQAAGLRAVEHLREVCGGGEIVIRQDGTLATLLEGLGIDFCTAHQGVRNEDERECDFARADSAECVLSEAFIVVPVAAP